MVLFENRFIQGLEGDNPWWNGGKVAEKLPTFHRCDYDHYLVDLEKHMVKVIIGPRRVGKTVLMQQIVDHLLTEKEVNPKSILFLSLERHYFELLPNKIADALEYFETQIYGKPISQAKETVYIFIDEAQYDSTWVRIMKEFMDKNLKVHGLVSGSSPTALYKDKESAAGRLHERQMVAMKFRDVLRMLNPEYDKEIVKISYGLRDAFVEACKKKDPAIYQKAMATLRISEELKVKIQAGLEEYLLKGGYPEFYFDRDGNKASWEEISRHYERNVFDSILQKDVVNTFNLRSPEKIRRLFVTLAENTAKILTRPKLAETLNLKNVKTVDAYVDSLGEAFLVRTAAKFKKKGYPSTKENKFYATDTGLRNSVLGVIQISSPEERGDVIETVVFNHSLRLGYHLDGQIRGRGYYWMFEKGERDLVLDIRAKYGFPLAIEVKNGQAGLEDIKKMKGTIRQLSAPFGMIVCRDQIGSEGNVIVVPAWIFLLSC